MVDEHGKLLSASGSPKSHRMQVHILKLDCVAGFKIWAVGLQKHINFFAFILLFLTRAFHYGCIKKNKFNFQLKHRTTRWEHTSQQNIKVVKHLSSCIFLRNLSSYSYCLTRIFLVVWLLLVDVYRQNSENRGSKNPFRTDQHLRRIRCFYLGLR